MTLDITGETERRELIKGIEELAEGIALEGRGGNERRERGDGAGKKERSDAGRKGRGWKEV